MSDYYGPTLLFRNNAIRRFSPELSPVESMGFEPPHHGNGSWLLNPENPRDSEVISKTCSLNRLNIKSNYWKIPDPTMNLTSLAVNSSGSIPKIAISSGSNNENLFLYLLDLQNNYLTHTNTITLPHIHLMQWVPGHENFVVTGNNKGYAHLVAVPGAEEQSASICKRFNHRKHLKAIDDNPHTNQAGIERMAFTKSGGLLTKYNNSLFLWDVRDCETQERPRPISISNIPGLHNFDPTFHQESSTIAICGRFGVSLFDTRQPKFGVPASIVHQANRSKMGSTLIKWSPKDEYVFAAVHNDGVVRLWDVRKQESYAQLDGHLGRKIISMEWNNGDLFTGGKDGNIVHWDLLEDGTPATGPCGLKEGLASVSFNAEKNSLQDVSQRQCGTVLPASNSTIVGMASVALGDDVRVLSVDSSSFFGVHSKIYDAVKVDFGGKLYYSDEDMRRLVDEQMSQSLGEASVEPQVESTKPLAIARSVSQYEHPARAMSNETLTSDTEPCKLAIDQYEVTSDAGSDEFNFAPIGHANGSLESVATAVSAANSVVETGSQHSISLLPGFDRARINDSLTTLDTAATIDEVDVEQGHQKHSSLGDFAFLVQDPKRQLAVIE